MRVSARQPFPLAWYSIDIRLCSSEFHAQHLFLSMLDTLLALLANQFEPHLHSLFAVVRSCRCLSLRHVLLLTLAIRHSQGYQFSGLCFYWPRIARSYLFTLSSTCEWISALPITSGFHTSVISFPCHGKTLCCECINTIKRANSTEPQNGAVVLR